MIDRMVEEMSFSLGVDLCEQLEAIGPGVSEAGDECVVS
jgi:hypothetical protein